jgi:hypothetical protein
MNEHSELIAEIRDFIQKHAGISPNYDPKFDQPEDRFTGPDPSMLEGAAALLEAGKDIPFYVHSEWGSGCYKPYNDPEARTWHDDLVRKVNDLRITPAPKR